MYAHVWVDEIVVEYLMKPKQVLRKKNLSTNNKPLLNQFQHSLKSPKRFQQYLDRVASWLSRETGLHNYLSDGKLSERGRIKASGRKKVLIDLDELDSVLSSRKPGCRPRKT